MPFQTIDVLNDSRWDQLVLEHPRSGVFHTRGWLEALHRTYGYRALAISTSTGDSRLGDGVVFCDVRSWITGHRLVSLPFSDHCDLLADSQESELELMAAVRDYARKLSIARAEMRPRTALLNSSGTDWQVAQTFRLHFLPLTPAPETLFAQMHTDCIQRKVRRAEREGLTYQEGRSEELLSKFYYLLLLTRRRHSLPPQPALWFRNLVACMGESLTIHLASKADIPVAAVLTLSHKTTVTYKYGCSDERHHQLGGMPFLFWQIIRRAKQEGMTTLDLGRSDDDNLGLIQFKERLGARGATLSYLRWSVTDRRHDEHPWLKELGKRIFHRLPNSLLAASGRLLYKHIG